jgi:AcrR family transcriptional regulator
LRALECLQELSLEKGLDDVSMRDVAKRLGMSLAALQYHYASKAALLDAFVHQTVEGYRGRIDSILAKSPKGELFANLVRFAAMETLEWDRHSVLAMIESRAKHDEAAKRTVLMSSVESFANIVVGYGLAVLTQIALFPLFGVHASLRDNLAIGLAFTVVSFGRSLLLRRVFNWLSAMDLPVRGRPIRPD